MSGPRIVCRFSCGAASAVATKLALRKYDPDRVVITYSDTRSEHPDNKRFLADCQRWFNHEIITLASEEYHDIWDVFEKERFIASRHGAPCTGLLKREPTYSFSRPDDILVFGYTVEERDRAENFRKANFEITFETPLIEHGLTKSDCLGMLERAGIELPTMYKLGFLNNNCIGCGKGGMGYWNMIRVHFPEIFERMIGVQDELGPGSYFFREADGTRIPLRTLDPNRGDIHTEPNIECSLMCHLAEHDLKDDAA